MNKILPIILVVVLFSSNVFAEKYQSSSGFTMSIEGYMFFTETPSDLSLELGEIEADKEHNNNREIYLKEYDSFRKTNKEIKYDVLINPKSSVKNPDKIGILKFNKVDYDLRGKEKKDINLKEICETRVNLNNERYGINQRFYGCVWLKFPSDVDYSFYIELDSLKNPGKERTHQIQFVRGNEQYMISGYFLAKDFEKNRIKMFELAKSIIWNE
tara:strand:+ start:61 stop:702 length:642 start_codon:yes stop_codon:yes gene_type:complete